jgi:hypothetical protein
MRVEKYQIKEIASLILGHTFRVNPEAGIEGDSYKLVQVKDLDHDGAILLGQLETINYKFSRGVELVKPGDVIFCPREHKLVAALITEELDPTVVSAPLVLIRVHSREIVDPGYLRSYLNSAMARKQFQNLLSGSTILTINKTELADFEILIPSLEKQRIFAEMYFYSEQERKLREKLLELRSQERSNLINQSFRQLLEVK